MSTDYPHTLRETMTTPTLEKPNPALSKFHELLHKELVHQAKVSCCLSCIHFGYDAGAYAVGSGNDVCTKFNTRPPARVIVFGCDHWEVDDIPF